MSTIPDQISDSEPLTHALFYTGDLTKSPFWVKHQALIPPKNFPHEVSFNRACYIPDREQNRMATEINRPGKVFSGFVVLSPDLLKKALDIFKIQELNGHSNFTLFNVLFKYTPIFQKDQDEVWPEHIEKKWGNGYNPSHADLYYRFPVIPNDPNLLHTIFAKILCKVENKCCEVYEVTPSNKDSISWKGTMPC